MEVSQPQAPILEGFGHYHDDRYRQGEKEQSHACKGPRTLRKISMGCLSHLGYNNTHSSYATNPLPIVKMKTDPICMVRIFQAFYFAFGQVVFATFLLTVDALYE